VRSTVLLSALLITAPLTVGLAGPCRVQAAQAQPAPASYGDAVAAATKLLAQNKPVEARAAYETAFGLAKTAEERADVRFALANTYPKAGEAAEARAELSKLLLIPEVPPSARVKALVGRASTFLRSQFPSGADINSALEDLDAAAKVDNAPDPDRAFAHLQKATILLRLTQADKAQLSLAAVLALPGALDHQKADALLGTGNYHFQKKEYAKARAAWSQVSGLKVGNDQKLTAHRSLVQGYLAENQSDQALDELEKATQLPGLTGGEKARLFDELGQLLQSGGKFAAARASYTKIVELPDAGAIQKLDATLSVGRTYAGEKNYTAARAEWEKLTGDKTTTHAVQALQYIALSHAEEKNYAPARAAVDRWLALPQDDYWKEDGWLLLGQLHELESSWSAARDAYQKLTQSPKARSTRKVRAILGLVRTHEADKNADAVLQDYALLPDAMKPTRERSPAEASELVQLQTALIQHLGKLAANYGKERSTLPSAIALYHVSEKLQPTDADRASISLDLGDLLFGQGMLDEAKAEYQKVTTLPFAADAQRTKAAAKLKEIEAKKAAG